MLRNSTHKKQEVQTSCAATFVCLVLYLLQPMVLRPATITSYSHVCTPI
jgi:hypothetical protein